MSFRITTLDSGMRVATDAMDGVESAAVGVWVDVGARDEPAALNGVSHLLEHMAFKGTRRRDARAIAQEIEDVGGHVNAYTSREHTAYFARVLKDDLPLAIDILADILQHSTFVEEELEKERGVVMQEIALVHDTPDDLVFDLYQQRAFPDQPLGRPILGTSAGVERLGRDALTGFLGRFYTAEAMVVAAAGAVDHDEVVRLAERGFVALPRREGHAPEPASYGGGAVEREEAAEQAHLVLGVAGVGFDDDDFYAVQLLTTLLGGGMSSRLFQEVRERRGLAYSIYAFHSSYVDCGLFGVYAGCAAEDTGEVATLVAEELAGAAASVEAEELDRARTQHQAGLLMARESTPSRCENAARQLLVHGRHVPQDEIVARLDAVTVEDARRCALRLFGRGRPTMATVGPQAGMGRFGLVADRFG